MIRNHKKGNRVSEHFYCKGDGTFVYYFSKESLNNYFNKLGYETLSIEYCTIFLENRKTKVNLTRVWINAVFRKAGRKD
jgi:tRNAThr (cytosine32-N3)-methyltransferase